MLTGLSKRPSYEELINELGEDPIKKYPDRRASQIENSNYMSQLASGFQEVLEQNDKVMKEKAKELLLHDMAAGCAVSHQSFRSLSNDGIGNLLARAGTGARPSFLPSQTPPVEQFQIGSPRSVHSAESSTSAQRAFRAQLFGPPIDPELLRESLKNQMEIDDDERRRRENQLQISTFTRTILHQANATGVHNMINKAATPALQILDPDFAEAVHRDTLAKSERLNKQYEDLMKDIYSSTPSAVAVPNLFNEPSSSSGLSPKRRTAPKKFSKPNPEADDEPEITRSRSKERGFREKEKEKKSSVKKAIKETVKKVNPIQQTGAVLIFHNSVSQWLKQGKGVIGNQAMLRGRTEQESDFNESYCKRNIRI